jgi:hypothetical protein
LFDSGVGWWKVMGMPKFMLPEGVEIPEGVKMGDRFQVVSTLVMKDGGKVEMVEVDGVPIAGYEKEGKEKEESEDSDEGEMEGEAVAVEGPKGRGFIEEVMAQRMGA